METICREIVTLYIAVLTKTLHFYVVAYVKQLLAS